MHFRRNNRRLALDLAREELRLDPVKGPMLIIAAVLLLAGGAAAAIAAGMERHGEPLWALAVVWALVAIVFAVLALWPGPHLRVEIGRELVELDGATHSLSHIDLSYQRIEQATGRRTIVYYALCLAVAGRRIKLMELGKSEEDLAHNLVAGVQQIQGGQKREGLETLKDAIECAAPAAGREVLMVVALILAPLFVFWLKGAF
jgi:hypothetical protein